MVNIDNIYVPPDECMNSKKMSEVISSSIQAAVPFLIHGAKSFFEQESSSFESFDEMHYIFSGNRSLIVEEWITENLINVLPPKVFKEITYESIGAPFKSPLPQIIAGDLAIYSYIFLYTLHNNRHFHFSLQTLVFQYLRE